MSSLPHSRGFSTSKAASRADFVTADTSVRVIEKLGTPHIDDQIMNFQ